MDERDYYTEQPEVKIVRYRCTKCRVEGEYRVRWIRRTKKKVLPRHATDQDRIKFAKAMDHYVRVDDELICRNPRCGRTFEIPDCQTVVFIR